MTDTNEPAYVLCMRIEDATNVVDGSIPAPCSKCDYAVWAAPSTVGVLYRGAFGEVAGLICTQCAGITSLADVAARAIHSHSWLGQELRCSCGMTYSEFRNETAPHLDPPTT